jgi:hypothetical protein
VTGRNGVWRAAMLSTGLVVTLALPAPGASAGSKPSGKDAAILGAGVISATDVPSNWTLSPQRDTGSKDFTGIAACKQIQSVTDAARKSVPRILSPRFTDPASPGAATRAEDAVLAFKSVGAASKYVQAYQSSHAGTCYQKALEHTNSTSGLHVSPIPGLAGVGDTIVGYEVAASAAVQGQRLPVYFDVIVVRAGRAIVRFQFVSMGPRIAQGPTILLDVIKRVAPLAK